MNFALAGEVSFFNHQIIVLQTDMKSSKVWLDTQFMRLKVTIKLEVETSHRVSILVIIDTLASC